MATVPNELRIGHILLEPGNPREQEPPRIWVVVGYEGHGQKTCKLRSAAFGEALTLKCQADRIPPGWLFVHSELLAGLLARHAVTLDAGSEIDCPTCAVFGGPGTVETIAKAGH